jgi:hypothetical protein
MRFLRALFALLGALAFLAAAAALAAEIASYARSGTPFAKPLGLVWREQHLLSLQLFQVGVERKLGLDWLWRNVFQEMLGWRPIAVSGAFAALGLVLLIIARLFRRRRGAVRASRPLNRAA